MKLGINWIIECPNCKAPMIISNPTKQNKTRDEHEIKHLCGECKKIIILYIEVGIKMWEIKENA